MRRRKKFQRFAQIGEYYAAGFHEETDKSYFERFSGGLKIVSCRSMTAGYCIRAASLRDPLIGTPVLNITLDAAQSIDYLQALVGGYTEYFARPSPALQQAVIDRMIHSL